MIPNDPAFPVVFSSKKEAIDNFTTRTTNEFYGGLTKREHFAGLAMQGLLSDEKMIRGIVKNALSDGRTESLISAEIASYAVELADALLLELSKP